MEVCPIKIPIKSAKKDIILFLQQIKNIIEQEDFNIEQDFQMITSRKADMKYSTPYTLIGLEYDVENVIQVIGSLTIEDYSQTLIDSDNSLPPLLFVFGKNINNKEVYIKLKIKEQLRKYILCVSFHYAEHQMPHPYA